MLLILSSDESDTASAAAGGTTLDNASTGAPDTPVQQLAGGIAFAEGFWDINENDLIGTIPNNNNNPGDIVSGGAYATFDTPEDGFAALYAQIELIVNGQSGVYNLGMSIAQMGQRWTPSPPNTASAPVNWAANVVAFLNDNYGLGVTVNTPLSAVLL